MSSNNVPKISIVTPSYNMAGTIKETIDSILEQNDPNFEHIVTDGASSDETVEVLLGYSHLTWVSEPDGGQTEAINKGLEMSTGEIVAYLNSDDVYRPGAFQRVRELFDTHPDSDVLVGTCDIIDESSKLTGKYEARLDSRHRLPEFWQWEKGFCIPQPGVFIRRRALDVVGLFDPNYDMAMDYEMWLRLAEKFEFLITDEVLAGFRITPDTKSMTRRSDMILDCYRAARRFSHLAETPAKFRNELRKEAAGHLLTIAEEHGERPDPTRGPGANVRLAAKIWPPLLLSPRARKLLFAKS